MSEAGVQIRCQRCGEQMELKDPAPGQPWVPQQFWTCPKCGRHFWTTYVSQPGAPKPQPPPATPGATTPAPTAQAAPAAVPAAAKAAKTPPTVTEPPSVS